MSKPFTPNLIRWYDYVIFGGVSLIFFVFAILASLEPENQKMEHLPGFVILWVATTLSVILPFLFFWFKKRSLSFLKYITDQGVTVGWNKPEYAVRPEQVEAIIAGLLVKLKTAYPSAVAALNNCVVIFQEPIFSGHAVYDKSAGKWLTQKVTGLQDGLILYVGWREDLTTSALEHELCHRVLQIYAGDPPQDVAHKMMVDLGVP